MSLQDKIIIIASSVSAIATLAIAIFTYINFKLTKEIKRINDKSNYRFDELFISIIASTLATHPRPGYEYKVIIDNYKKFRKDLLENLNLK